LFFFQAEDGIRDDLVTGVQTCALPIFRNVGRRTLVLVAHDPPRSTLYSGPKNTSEYSRYGNETKPGYPSKSVAVHSHTSPTICRSEERRVGKECSSTRSPVTTSKQSSM